MRPLTYEEALRKLGNLCARGEQCTGEVDEKMKKWGLSEADRQRVVSYLVAHQYIDDERFARAFVHDKLAYDGWGRRKIEQALCLKHIDGNIRQQVLDEVAEEEWLNALRPVICSKRKTIKSKDAWELSAKLVKYALGRGFTYDEIRQCIDNADEVTGI